MYMYYSIPTIWEPSEQINSLWFNEAVWCLRSWSISVQVIAWCLRALILTHQEGSVALTLGQQHDMFEDITATPLRPMN